MEPVILAGIGGALGAVLRFECSEIGIIRGIPAGTLVVNTSGSFIFSLIVFSHAPSDLFWFAGAGAMGGFTTFSTFSYETFRMLESHDYYTMAMNILTNGAGSIAGAALAFLLCAAL